MAKTLREKYIEALHKEGYKEAPSLSSKYIRFHRTENSYWYVGKSGSLRVGRSIAESIPCSNKLKSFLLSRVDMPAFKNEIGE